MIKSFRPALTQLLLHELALQLHSCPFKNLIFLNPRDFQLILGFLLIVLKVFFVIISFSFVKIEHVWYFVNFYLCFLESVLCFIISDLHRRLLYGVDDV